MTKLDIIKSRCHEVGDCWIWFGAKDGHGRPSIRHEGKTVYVRRLVRELVDGKPIPAGMRVACRCGIVQCVSPHCSKVATEKEKSAMASKRGAYSRPDKFRKMMTTLRSRSHITDEMVEQIRLADGPARVIAEATGVSVSHVKAIRRGAARRDYKTNPFASLIEAANDPSRHRA